MKWLPVKIFFITSLATLVIAGCGGGTGEVKTGEHLLAAYNGESTVRAKYLDYATLADEESLSKIALMFRALAKSEEIHANNHRAALATMGIHIAKPDIAKYMRSTTVFNIEDAIRGELYEVDTMYAAFVKVAEKEGNKVAHEAFTWAMDTEKKHAEQLQSLLDILTGAAAAKYPMSWYVCRKCGNTFKEHESEDPCPFCETPADEFISFSIE
jgi:rubrerythrin